MATCSTTRFAGLSEDELVVTLFAYQQVAKRIMDRAAGDEYAAADLAEAASTFRLVSVLAGEVADGLGEAHPNVESIDAAASCIALGEAPTAAAVHAEVETTKAEARAAFGTDDDVSLDHAELVASYESGPGSTTPEDR